MNIGLQIVAGVVGLGFVAMLLFAAVYIGDELERTALRPLGRFMKAIVGGLVWALAGVVVVALLFVVGIVVRYIFFRPVFSFYLYQFWAIRVGLVIVGMYLLWGLYHGARNRLPESYRFRRDKSNNELSTTNNEL